MKGLIAFAVCLTAVGCSDNSGSSNPEKELTQNFHALVMGGRQTDARQDWSTVANTPVTVSVDMGTSDTYRVYILLSSPFFDAEATFLGMVRIPSGQQKTITIPRPADTALLYAACYDSDGHAVCKPFIVGTDGAQVTFEGRHPTTEEAPVFTSTADDAWYVKQPEQPDITAYSEGELVDIHDAASEREALSNAHLIISNYYEGALTGLAVGQGSSVYVTGNWYVTARQTVIPGNTIVVGEGGRLAIASNVTLTTSSPDSTQLPVNIYVMPGGTLYCNGTLNLNDANVYNGGTVIANNITLKGTTFINTGTLGSSEEQRYPTIQTYTSDRGNTLFINTGKAQLASVSGGSLTLQNANELTVNNGLTLSADSRLGDGSYTTCGSLSLQGSDDGNTLYMGNAAYLACAGNAEMTRFGVWGPSGDHFTANAVLQLRRSLICQPVDGLPATFLLDHVELVIPTTQTLLTDCWMNGYYNRLQDSDNYGWSSVGSKYCYLWTGGATANGIDAARQTCTVSTSPSYSYGLFTKGEATDIPFNNCVYYAFEIPEDNFMDFDFNDVVLRVNAPTDNGDGTFSMNIQAMCVGTGLQTTLLYNGEPLGDELHSVMGVAVGSTVNVSSASRVFSRVDGITISDTNLSFDRLPFSLQVTDSKERTTVYSLQTSEEETPFYIAVSGDNASRWYWPREGVNIGLAYSHFSNWGANVSSAPQWYRSNYADRARVVTWTEF